MNSRQKTVLLGVGGLLLVFVLFWIGINNIFLMLAALMLTLAILVIIKKKRPELFAGFRKKSKRKSGGYERPEVKPMPKTDKTYMVLSEGSGSDACQIIVDHPVYRIGRADDCNHVLSGKDVSRHHLRIEYSEAEGCCYAIDENSVNGSFLNSGKMEAGVRYRLIQGDRVVISDRSFAVEYAHY